MTLSEEYVQDSFHSYLKSSLTQAKSESLLDSQILSSAEADLMVTGPALSLYFAALRSTTSPPSVPLPRRTSTKKSLPPTDLSPSNCPPAFLPFFHLWSATVPAIQRLAPEHQHDLARIICGLDPIAVPTNPALGSIAADLRAVAIDISQRRSFQDRYAGDLQAAIDSGSGAGLSVKASFVPPPSYDTSPASSAASSPRYSEAFLSPPSSPPSAAYLSPTSAASPHPHRTPSPEPRARTPTLLSPTSPAISLIRETLYAVLADVLTTHPSVCALLTTDPPRAYFAAVALAILALASTPSTFDPDTGAIRGVLGRELTLDACPAQLRPFMTELAAIGRAARDLAREDDERAVAWAQGGEGAPPLPRLDGVTRVLEEGAAAVPRPDSGGRRSVEGRTVAFANRVNALSLGLTRLKAFRERQAEVFEVLKGVAGG